MATRKPAKGGAGYGQPPVEHQFKTGRSGNPKGRPKGSRNLSKDIEYVLGMPVPIERDGKRRQVSTQLATLLRLREMALKGDARSIERLVALAAQRTDKPDENEKADPLAAEDQAILDAYYESRRRREADVSDSPADRPTNIQRETR